MPTWFERFQKRQRELAEGADADLMQANKRRSRVSLCLFGLAIVLILFNLKFPVPTLLEKVLLVVAGVSAAAGIVIGKWAQAEHGFLTDPDPESPPEIFRDNENPPPL
jgi:hypothetical protein